MTRTLTAELLDSLPADDPRAVGSRRDLARINALMGNAKIVAHALSTGSVHRVLELGAGDGREALRWGTRLAVRGSEITLLDHQPVVPPSVRDGFRSAGWTCEVVADDALAFLESTEHRWDAIVSNLFIHHFETEPLRSLLDLIARRCDRFVACEPARTRLAYGASRALRLLGCNAVTLHDARVSVEAGFANREISSLWPKPVEWTLEERDAFPFSHFFHARRKDEKV